MKINNYFQNKYVKGIIIYKEMFSFKLSIELYNEN